MTTCSYCSRSTPAARLPPGWHREGGEGGPAVCADCWAERYVLRAISLPVVGPAGGEDGGWPALRETLRTCWRASTSVANLVVRELAKVDVSRTPAMEKLPKMEHPYLYPVVRAAVPDLDPTSATALIRSVERRYAADRWEAVWLRRKSLPSYRYPVPYPIHNQAWGLTMDGGNRPILSARFGGRRWNLRLRTGKRYARQKAALAHLVAGRATRGELSILECPASSSTHRTGTTERDGGGQRLRTGVVAKLVLWLPREPSNARGGVLVVRTTKDALLEAVDVVGERVWVDHCDQVRRWAAEHRRRLQRWADDQKAEQRPTASYQSRREASAQKFRDRMASLTHEVSAHVVGLARRRRYAEIAYDDQCRDFVPDFPWHALWEKIRYKAESAGIRCERVGGEDQPGDRSQVADGTQVQEGE